MKQRSDSSRSNVVSSKWSDLFPRTASAILLVPVALELVFLGGAWFQMIVAFAGVVIAREYTSIAHQGNERQFACYVIGVLAATIMFVEFGLPTTLVAIAIAGILSNVILIWENDQPTIWQRIGVAYVSLPVLALMVLRGDSTQGLTAAFFLLLLVWAADTFAYFFGRIIGGPKLSPRWSPKKTWAGLAGAILGAAIIAVAFIHFGYATGGLIFIALAGLLALLEQAGDIAESAFKRAHDRKDSGQLIPGHGGMLDRVDGLLAVFSGAAILGTIHNSLEPAIGLMRWAP